MNHYAFERRLDTVICMSPLRTVDQLGKHIPETEYMKRLTLIFDSGERMSKISSERPLRSLLASQQENSIVQADNDHQPDLSQFDSTTTLVIAMSSTVDFDYYESQGFTIYPSSEKLRRASDKWALYEKCRELGIPTVLTFLLPPKAYKKAETQEKLDRLQAALQGAIVKPLNTFGPGRDTLEQIYPNVVASFEAYSKDGENAANAEFVMQKEHQPPAIKAFGAWPDQFFYPDETGQVKKCPPNIQRTCRRLCEEFDVRWAGFDFLINDDGTWLIIDINPPSGGRAIPPQYEDDLAEAMQNNVQALLRKEPLRPQKQKIQMMVAAAGEGSRLQSMTEGLPKSLIDLGDGKTVLDFNMRSVQALADQDGFSGSVRLYTQPELGEFFQRWVATRQAEEVSVVFPDETLYEQNSSYNHALACLPPDTDLIVISPADRVAFLSASQLQEIAEEIQRALQEDEVPYVVVGVRDDSSKHRYVTDSTGRILNYVRESENPHTGMGVKKILFGCDVSKITVPAARNTYEVVNAQMRAGSLGRLIVLESEVQNFDVDTPADVVQVQEYFQTVEAGNQS